jgi:hypothetical protein
MYRWGGFLTRVANLCKNRSKLPQLYYLLVPNIRADAQSHYLGIAMLSTGRFHIQVLWH